MVVIVRIWQKSMPRVDLICSWVNMGIRL